MLSRKIVGLSFYVTVSPANVDYLAQTVPSTSFLNLHTYTGCWNSCLQNFLDIGSQDSSFCIKSIPNRAAGPGVLRRLWKSLNSGRYVYELQLQEEMYAFFRRGDKLLM